MQIYISNIKYFNCIKFSKLGYQKEHFYEFFKEKCSKKNQNNLPILMKFVQVLTIDAQKKIMFNNSKHFF